MSSGKDLSATIDARKVLLSYLVRQVRLCPPEELKTRVSDLVFQLSDWAEMCTIADVIDDLLGEEVAKAACLPAEEDFP